MATPWQRTLPSVRELRGTGRPFHGLTTAEVAVRTDDGRVNGTESTNSSGRSTSSSLRTSSPLSTRWSQRIETLPRADLSERASLVSWARGSTRSAVRSPTTPAASPPMARADRSLRGRRSRCHRAHQAPVRQAVPLPPNSSSAAKVIYSAIRVCVAHSLSVTSSWNRRCTGPHCSPSQTPTKSDLIERTAKVLGTGDEGETAEDLVAIEPIARLRAGGGGDEADNFVVTERRRAEARALGDLADDEGAHTPHSEGSTPEWCAADSQSPLALTINPA